MSMMETFTRLYAGSSEPVHLFFGLSYGHYVVVPRSIAQAMPLDWQRDFTRLMCELMDTEPGQQYSQHHYLVQRTCPERDAEIHEADLEDSTPPEILVIEDPFFNYRYPVDVVKTLKKTSRKDQE